MENNQEIDAVKEEGFNFVTDSIEDVTNSSYHDVGYVEPKQNEEKSAEEAVEESAEEAPTEITDVPHKENPSRFEYWQSKFSQEQQARKELEDKIQTFEQKMNTFSKTPEPEPLRPPQKPDSDDPLDKMEYLEKMVEYQNSLVSKQQEYFEKQEQARRQAEEQANFKAYALGEYQKAGADQNLSQETFNFFSSEQSLDFATQLEMYKALKNVPKNNSKVDQIKAKGEKYKAPLPPGVVSGDQEAPQTLSFGEDLLSFQKNKRAY